MGRRWNRKRKVEEGKAKKARQEQKRAKTDKSGYNKKPWALSVHENKKMEAYYALQGLHNVHLVEDGTQKCFVQCETDEQRSQERKRWLNSLRTMLPVSFRIGTDVDEFHREQMELELEEFVGTEMEIVMDPAGGTRRRPPCGKEDAVNAKESSSLVTKRIAPARRIPFIPHAYQLSLDRRTIRRNPALEKFHNWLTAQTAAGFITRQETVSMIPPVVLSVEPHHLVLDMCAAPGSKTSQLLEIVSTPTDIHDLEPRGSVVANDSDPKRAFMLVHQLRRINSPAVLVTSCDAQFFPLLKGISSKEEEGMFDRVLCDVPCSGDGTTRKNPGVWKHWSALGSLALHPLQLSIALNGARLTKVGGYICYSTCAMNPVENEAVVAELLRAADGALELVDKRPDMRGLMARPGWSTWRVLREDKSRKQVKNERKKKSEKMQQRRKAWEEETKNANDDDDGGAVVVDESIMDNDVKDNAEKKNQDSMDDSDTKLGNNETCDREEGDNKSDDDDDANEVDDGNNGPPTWDEATLVGRARAEGLVEYKTFEEVPEQWRRKVRKTVFPPTKEEADRFGLEKCLRCLPHDMDTGGFFVALLRKVAPMGARAKKEAMELAREIQMENDAEETKPAMTDNMDGLDDNGSGVARKEDEEGDGGMDGKDADDDANLDADSPFADTAEVDNTDLVSQSEATQQDAKRPFKGNPRRQQKGQGDDERFIALDDSIWEPIVDFYGLSDTFPRDQYMARACGEAKALYFVGAPIKNLLNHGIQDRLKVINTGLKGFGRNTKDCKIPYRVAQEGIHYLAPHMEKRKIFASYDDFGRCIESGTIRLEVFSDEFAEAVRKLEPGSFVVALKGYERDVFQKLFLVMWRCRGDAVDCLVAKVEMEGMKSKLRATQRMKQGETPNVAAA